MSVTKKSSTARSYPVRIPRVAAGPLAPTVLGGCSAWSAAPGYTLGSAAGVVNVLGRLSLWMQDVGAGVDDIDEALLAEFVAAELARDLPCASVKRWTGTMRRFLTSTGYLGCGRAGTVSTHAGPGCGHGVVFVDARSARPNREDHRG